VPKQKIIWKNGNHLIVQNEKFKRKHSIRKKK